MLCPVFSEENHCPYFDSADFKIKDMLPVSSFVETRLSATPGHGELLGVKAQHRKIGLEYPACLY